MTGGRWALLDLLAGVVSAACWLGAGAAVGVRRARLALALSVAGVVATVARTATVVALAGGGWWFVQEKVTLTLPLAGATALAAVAVAGPWLVRAAGPGGRAAAAGPSPAVLVSVLVAGYAAAAGVVVTFLGGYPATWGVALVTVALVGGAGLVTWRVATPATSSPQWRFRAVLAGALAAGLAGVALAVVPDAGTDAGGGPAGGHGGHAIMVTSLRGPTAPDPGGVVRRIDLTARTATVTLVSGRRVAAWTFNGRVPGPPITVTEGDLVETVLRNDDITAGVTVHWHGLDVPAGEDGVPGLTQDPVRPGGEFVYRFVARQVGTYWYHTHEASDEGVRMGLYGTVVVLPRRADPAGVDLTLPVHTFGATTVLGSHDGVDGRAVPAGTTVRLRLVNTDSTPHRFTVTGVRYRIVAVDGADLTGPTEMDRVGLRLPAGGRYDLAFTMPAGPVALLVDDRPDGGLRLAPAGVARSAGDETDGWPEWDPTTYGAPAAPGEPHRAARFDRRFALVLDRGLDLAGGLPRYAHTVNGHAFPAVPTMVVRRGDLVLMTVVNRGTETHPWHLHGHRVLVLARDGRPVTGSPLWVDTFDVRPGEVWEVAFRADNPGLWMNHCHNLAHADRGMALHLAYDGFGTPLSGAHGG